MFRKSSSFAYPEMRDPEYDLKARRHSLFNHLLEVHKARAKGQKTFLDRPGLDEEEGVAEILSHPEFKAALAKVEPTQSSSSSSSSSTAVVPAPQAGPVASQQDISSLPFNHYLRKQQRDEFTKRRDNAFRWADLDPTGKARMQAQKKYDDELRQMRRPASPGAEPSHVSPFGFRHEELTNNEKIALDYAALAEQVANHEMQRQRGEIDNNAANDFYSKPGIQDLMQTDEFRSLVAQKLLGSRPVQPSPQRAITSGVSSSSSSSSAASPQPQGASSASASTEKAPIDLLKNLGEAFKNQLSEDEQEELNHHAAEIRQRMNMMGHHVAAEQQYAQQAPKAQDINPIQLMQLIERMNVQQQPQPAPRHRRNIFANILGNFDPKKFHPTEFPEGV